MAHILRPFKTEGNGLKSGEMFRVQYFCPRQAPYWQAAGSFMNLNQAVMRAQVVKPPRGSARVLDPWGRQVYVI
jgi:hypothetical protein